MVEPIGILTVLVGLACLFLGPTVSIYALILSTLLGAAAAAILTFVGGANIPPAHVLLGFVTLLVLLDVRYFRAAVQSFVLPQPGSWLLLTVIYGAIATIFLPRIFADETNVFAIARDGQFAALALVPLRPVSGNATQMIYFIADLVCFAVIYALASDRRHTLTFAHAGIACAIANLVFGLLDVITYNTNTTELLSFVRNANYTMLFEAELAGFKRIVGSFTEASAYASTTLWLLAFTGRLWLAGFRPVLTGCISALLVLAIIFATSTTGYAGFIIYLIIEYARSLRTVLLAGGSWPLMAFVTLAPLFAILILIALALHEPAWATILEVVQITFLEKEVSQSGIERGSWNAQGFLNVIETMGLGVGVGSTRTSSWLLAVPVSLGIPGTLTYFAFVLGVVFAKKSSNSAAAAVQGAAKGACIAQLIAAVIGGAFVDLGLPFFICAAVAIGLQDSRATSPAPFAFRERQYS